MKAREVALLVQFADYCDRHGLNYVLAGGTLLGAVRHQGFIPWDDDIDVCMPRPDYQRFIQLQMEHPEFSYVTVTNDTMSYPFLKLLDTEVIVDMTYVDTTGSEHLWMDVFPIDGLPKEDQANRRLFQKSLFLRRLLFVANAKMGKGTTLARRLGKIPLHILLTPIGRFRLAHWIDNLCQKIPFESSPFAGGLAWGYGPQERMPKEGWVTRKKVLFEGHEFWAPGCTEQYLSSLYGDYMQLPPKEQQVPHNMTAWLKEQEEKRGNEDGK